MTVAILTGLCGVYLLSQLVIPNYAPVATDVKSKTAESEQAQKEPCVHSTCNSALLTLGVRSGGVAIAERSASAADPRRLLPLRHHNGLHGPYLPHLV